jgi:hypothetical protein
LSIQFAACAPTWLVSGDPKKQSLVGIKMSVLLVWCYIAKKKKSLVGIKMSVVGLVL